MTGHECTRRASRAGAVWQRLVDGLFGDLAVYRKVLGLGRRHLLRHRRIRHRRLVWLVLGFAGLGARDLWFVGDHERSRKQGSRASQQQVYEFPAHPVRIVTT